MQATVSIPVGKPVHGHVGEPNPNCVLEPSVDGVRAQVFTVTPEIAQYWLNEKNRINRKIRPHRVARYARIMANGLWMLNGEALVFDSNGDLRNGQHRLQACVNAGASFPAVVVRGVDPSVFGTFDQGIARTNGDVLGLSGEMHANILAGAIKLLWRYELARTFGTAGLHDPSGLEVEDWLEGHPSLRVSVAHIAGLRPNSGKSLMSPSLAAALHYLFSRKDSAHASLFFERVFIGMNLAITSPELILRNRLIQESNSKAKVPQVYLAAVTIKAWNASRREQPVRLLKWTDSEEFPEIK